MLVQAMWVDDSPLLQLPHFDSDRIRRCERAGIKDIGDLLNMDDEDRVKLLDMTEKELEDVANVCNKYPSVAMEYRVVDEEIVSGESAEIEVKLAREDEDYIDMVYAPYFPKVKLSSLCSSNIHFRKRKNLSGLFWVITTRISFMVSRDSVSLNLLTLTSSLLLLKKENMNFISACTLILGLDAIRY